MPSNDTAALVVALSAQLSRFEKDMASANKIADRGVRNIEDRFASLNPAFAKVSSTVAGIGSSFLSAAGIAGLGFAGLLATAVSLNAELAKIPALARLAGVSTDRLQEIKFAGAVKGVGDDAFTTSLDASVRLLDEAQRQVNTLSRLFAANGVSIRDQNGDLIKFDQLLEIAARLMVNTRTEQEKIKVAEMLGLSRDWVAVLRDGPEAFRASAAGARDAGAVIDKEILDKAKQFDRAWTEAVVKFKAGFTDALVDLSRAFSEFFQNLFDSIPGSSFFERVLDTWAGGLSRFTLPELKDLIKRSIEEGAGAIEVARIQAEIDKRTGKEPLKITVHTDVVGADGNAGETIIPKDKQKNAFDSAVFETNKRIAATDAETRSVGLNSDARERAKIVAELEEAAKKANTDAGYQNATVTDLQRQKIEELADAMAAAAKRQHDSHAELLRFAVDAGDFVKQIDQTAISSLNNLGSALTDIATGSVAAKEGFKNFGLQVVKSLTEMIIKMSILAPLARSLSGILGGLGGDGGGFFGGSPETNPALVPIGSNAGGTDNWPGGLSWVGEKGPELLNLPRGSQVIPNSAIGRGGGGIVNNVEVVTPPGATVEREERRNNSGGTDLRVIIDAAVADRMTSPGSQTNSVMRSRFGIAPSLTQR